MRRASRRGDNALEFALLLPVLLLFIFGIIEGGWYMNRSFVISAAAQEGARAAAMVPEGGDVAAAARAKVLEKIGALIDSADVTVATTVAGTNPDRTVTVTVTVPYTPLAGSYVPAPSSIATTVELHMEEERPELEE